MIQRFVHLHCHTEYSLVDSLIRIDTLVNAVSVAGMPAVAITDQSNLFALVKFYRAAQAAGLKPIIGVDVWIRQKDERSRLVLLCQNTVGYRHLTRLVSKSYQEGQTQKIPYLSMDWLAGATEGLIALSGGREGNVGRALLDGHDDLAQQQLAEWQALFPQRFYLELQRTGRPQEEDYIHSAIELAIATGIPVVATNDVRFLSAEDFEAHAVRVCVYEGCTLAEKQRLQQQYYSPQQYLRTPDEMAKLFADIPEALENSWLIAQRCNLELTFGTNFLPDFPVPSGRSIDEYFCEQARLGLEQRLARLFDNTAENFPTQRIPYDDRLNLELQVIEQMGFAGYFLIVADFIQWAKDNNIPVGPGRGSGAGSLVAYSLNITDLDPIHYELLFERFLNPERVSMPDFDIDFCMEGRDAVIDYVANQRYGRDRVSQIITYGTMTAKAVVRDVGRVLGYPYGFVDKIAKLIPFELGITLDKALESEETLRVRYRDEEEVRTLINMARKLEGLTRNVGTHAGGVVIAPTQLTDFTPLYCEEGSNELVTQFDKGDIEEIGLVKFDFLGLRTLTIIKWALEHINRFKEKPLDISTISLEDTSAFNLLKKGNTTAVFQLESSGIKKLIRRLQPDCFEDLVALVALYRPGPLQSGMVDDFIDRKHERARIEYPHPDLAPILKHTYGVILYQEQVMQIAQVLAGYTLGSADLLRRAMGKKKPEEMAKQRSVFLEGATARDVKESISSHIFDLMEHFAGYGFNRSHSCAYALISYQTAWLKAYYPAAFMAAVLSADMNDTDKIVHLLNECRMMKLKILSPDVNVSDYRFTIDSEQNQAIIYGLGAIKGAGEAAIKNMVEERTKNGIFADLFEFCRRLDLRKVTRRVLEPLIKSGACDNLGQPRAVLMASLENAIKFAERHSSDHATGQNDLFSLAQTHSPTTVLTDDKLYISTVDWTSIERLNGEKDSLGFYLSGHPIDHYLPELKRLTRWRLADVKTSGDRQTVQVAGWVIDVRVHYGQRGRLANITLEDHTDRLEVTIYSEQYTAVQNLLVKDRLLIVQGEVREDKFTGDYNMIASEILSLEQARENCAKSLLLIVAIEQVRQNLVADLAEILTPYRPGTCTVVVHYRHHEAQVELTLGAEWRVHPAETLIEKLKELLGQDHVKI
ncbi:MAG: DNA polymerase III subunit alpha, partial [Beggiatoa sp. IS2]